MTTITIETNSIDETQSLGRAIGALLEPGDLLLLHGTLGAGKTTLTQGIAWGAGVTGYAHSPTFVLVNEYEGHIPIHHIDLYRFGGGDVVEDLGEVEDLAIDEMLEDGACVVEWAERANEVFPRDHLSISLEPHDLTECRTITFESHGARYDRMLEELSRSRPFSQAGRRLG